MCSRRRVCLGSCFFMCQLPRWSSSYRQPQLSGATHTRTHTCAHTGGNMRHLASIRNTHAKARKRNKRKERSEQSQRFNQSGWTAVCVCVRSSPALSFSIAQNHPPLSFDLYRDTSSLPLPSPPPPSIRHSVCSLNSLTNDSGGGDAAPAADPALPPSPSIQRSLHRQSDG